MILGIGIDLVSFKRIEGVFSLYGDKFAKKILNKNEIEEYETAKDKVSFLAKRFAAKEAVGKAIGIGILNGALLKNIMIDHNQMGQPTACLRDEKYSHKHMSQKILLSISDEGNFAIANAILIES